ncbi:MAG: TatD family hydrolase [Syntrophorhabdus sp.]|jgi:TatD DNase family protein|nr:TatD family hydrolase [Syntrophorhabdus sp.]
MTHPPDRTILIDTHCHLNDPSFADSLDDVLDRARRAGVVRFIIPAYDRVSLPRTLELARLYPGVVFPAFGVHPWYLEDGALDELGGYLDAEETVAVGEIGLDLAPGMAPVEVQERAFVAQLDMAAGRGLPVLVHCRKAHERMLDILRDYRGRVTVVLHSFSGSAEVMERFLEIGCYVSFSGSVTRERAKKYHRCARLVPAERFLLETDAPSIATQTTVASLVEPLHTREVAVKVAELRGVSLEEVCRISTESACRLFGLERMERER